MSDREDESLSLSANSTYSPIERKSYYIQFLGKTRTLQENVNTETIGSLVNIMNDTDVIGNNDPVEDKVNYLQEVVLDSEMMSVSSDVLRRCTETLNKETSPYESNEFADKILNYMQLDQDTVSEEPNWSILGHNLLRCLNTTPHYSYLLGTLKPLEKKQTVRQKMGPREAQAVTKLPETIQAVNKIEDGVEETVQKIKALVFQYYKNNTEPLDFFKLILHPVEFGRTVENLLHVSFLVRDGYLKLVKDNKGRLIIQPSTKEAMAQAKKKGSDANVQNVLSLSPQQWEVLKEVYDLKKPMINFQTSGQT